MVFSGQTLKDLVYQEGGEPQLEGDGETLVDFRQQTNTIGLCFRKITLGLRHMEDGI